MISLLFSLSIILVSIDYGPLLEKHELVSITKEVGYKNKYILHLTGGKKVTYITNNFNWIKKNYLKQCQKVDIYIPIGSTRITTTYFHDISYREEDIKRENGALLTPEEKEALTIYFYIECTVKKKKTDKEKGFYTIKGEKPINKIIYLKKGE